MSDQHKTEESDISVTFTVADCFHGIKLVDLVTVADRKLLQSWRQQLLTKKVWQSLPSAPRMNRFLFRCFYDEKNHLSVDDFLAPLGGNLSRFKKNAESGTGWQGRTPQNRRTFHGLVPRSMCRVLDFKNTWVNSSQGECIIYRAYEHRLKTRWFHQNTASERQKEQTNKNGCTHQFRHE